jgi:UDP-N-acetylmuramate dehydrogenase
MNWQRKLKGKVKLNEPLKKYTTFKIGGPAKFLVEPQDADDLKLFLELRKKAGVPFRVIGSGSNILAGDRGFRGAVLKLSSPYFKRIKFDKFFLECGAGNSLGRVIAAAKTRGLSGLEFLSGIPGTAGGALVMNAGTNDKSIGSLVESVKVMDYNGRINDLFRTDLRLGYRRSNLSRYIILGCCLKLAKKGKKEIVNKAEEYLSRRRITQDLLRPSAGCIFKNPPGKSAGKLIDLCGLKGRKAGGAAVSKIHANFILNYGAAKAADVLKLMSLIKRRVKGKFNITLEPEIKIWR